MLITFLFAATDHLPEVPDHHADPDPESSPVCRASFPYSWGISYANTKLHSLMYCNSLVVLGAKVILAAFSVMWWTLHRETYWVSSICSTPRRPVCTSWPPCWTAGRSTRFVHCILIGITAAQLGQMERKMAIPDFSTKQSWTKNRAKQRQREDYQTQQDHLI